MSPRDKALLLSLSEGSEAALEELVYLLKDRVIKDLHHRYGATPTEATDALKDFLYQFVLRLRSNCPLLHDGSLATYCLGACRNIYLSTRQKIKEIEQEHLLPMESESSQTDFHRDLHRALAQLPSKCREVLTLYYSNRLTWAEVGSRLGYSKNYIRNKGRSCREHLRGYLGNDPF